MTISIILTIALIAYLLMVTVDYSRTTYQIRKLVKDQTLNKKIAEYNAEIHALQSDIKGIQADVEAFEKSGKKRKAKALQKRIAKLDVKLQKTQEARNSLNQIAKDVNDNQNFSVTKLRQIRADLKKYLYNSQR